jgi:hypothetical protein
MLKGLFIMTGWKMLKGVHGPGNGVISRMKRSFILAALLLGGCSANGITGLEGVQGYSGQEYFQVTFAVDKTGSMAAEPKSVLYVSGKENSTSQAYIEVYEKVLVIFDATGTQAFEGQQIRTDGQVGMMGAIGTAATSAIDAATGIPSIGAD